MPASRPLSLLDGPHQATLPLDIGGPIEPAASDEEMARRPVFTGAAVFARDPERYRLFCALFFEAGLGQMQACRLLGMSPQTGAAIIAREQAGMTAQQLRDMQAARARAVVTASLSAIQERLSDPEALRDIPLHHLAQTLQRAHEVGAMLAGDATSRVERVDGSSRAPRDAAADYLDSLPAADVRAIPAAESISAAEIGEARAEGDAGAEDGPEAGPEDGRRDKGASGQRDLQSRGETGLNHCKPMDKRDGSKASYAESYADTGATGAERDSSQAAAVVDGARVDGGERA
jgi:hypothetical protein